MDPMKTKPLKNTPLCVPLLQVQMQSSKSFHRGYKKNDLPSFRSFTWRGQSPILNKEFLIENAINYIEIIEIVKLIVYFI